MKRQMIWPGLFTVLAIGGSAMAASAAPVAVAGYGAHSMPLVQAVHGDGGYGNGYSYERGRDDWGWRHRHDRDRRGWWWRHRWDRDHDRRFERRSQYDYDRRGGYDRRW